MLVSRRTQPSAALLAVRLAAVPAALLSAGKAAAQDSAPAKQEADGIGNPPPKVAVNDGLFVRLPNGRVVGAFSIRNNDTVSHMLTGFRSPDCKTLDMEQWDGSPPNDGPLRMTVPAKIKMVFLRGGYHLACGNPSGGFNVGDLVPVTVTFRDLPPSQTQFEVKAFNPPPPRRAG